MLLNSIKESSFFAVLKSDVIPLYKQDHSGLKYNFLNKFSVSSFIIFIYTINFTIFELQHTITHLNLLKMSCNLNRKSNMLLV